MLDKIVVRTVRNVGRASMLTLPKNSGFKVDDVVSIRQTNENELVIKKMVVFDKVSD